MRGSNGASAYAFSDTDGFSKMASSVTNNGRRRGIVSETRNGRTQTRKIGDYEDSNNNDQQDEARRSSTAFTNDDDDE